MKRQNTTHQIRFIIIALATVLLVASGRPAYAAGTVAGTNVTTNATVDYQVGGMSQNQLNSAGSGAFVIDRRINMTVAESGGAYTTVIPATTDQALTFTITNSTNDMVDLNLLYSNDANGATGPFGGTDTFDTPTVRFYQENGATGGFQIAQDTLVTFLDEVAADGIKTLYVVSNIPSGLADTAYSFGKLTATAHVAGGVGALGALYTQTAGADTAAGVETVFGDNAGPATGDIARDGKHSDDDGYDVVTATITVTKTRTIISDPFNGTTAPKAIPGAVVEYCIQVSNTGSATASTVTIEDLIPIQSTYSAGSIVAGGTVTGGVCNPDGTAEDDDATGANDVLTPIENTGNYNSGTGKINTMVFSLPVGGTTASRFRVTLN